MKYQINKVGNIQKRKSAIENPNVFPRDVIAKSIFLFLTLIVISCSKGESKTLSDQEKSDLIYLREEEKLAHDVYIYSYNKYGIANFLNISQSEASHTTKVLRLLNKYDIADPVGNNAIGVFKDSTLQVLYNQLIIKSDSSLTKAFEVGANIEDMDIEDIKKFYSHTTNTDLLDTYNKLTCGSRNHLRSFVGQLGTYIPIYLPQIEYDVIANGDHEECGK